jgi:hypothetical protein
MSEVFSINMILFDISISFRRTEKIRKVNNEEIVNDEDMKT